MCHLEERRKIQNYSINITFSIEKEEYRVGSPQMSSLISAYSAVFHLKALMVFLSISSSLSGPFQIILETVLSSKLWKLRGRAKDRWHRGFCRRWLIWHFILIRLFHLIWALKSDIFCHFSWQTGREVEGEKLLYKALRCSRARKICCHSFVLLYTGKYRLIAF